MFLFLQHSLLLRASRRVSRRRVYMRNRCGKPPNPEGEVVRDERAVGPGAPAVVCLISVSSLRRPRRRRDDDSVGFPFSYSPLAFGMALPLEGIRRLTPRFSGRETKP